MSPDVLVDVFAHADGTSGVGVSVGGARVAVLPLGEAVARLTAMGDALRGAAEDLAVVLAGAR